VNGLVPVVRIDPEKCLNCHACIAACPVKYCNRAVGDTVEIDHGRCIGCGMCIDACQHHARMPVDDWEVFWNDLQSRVKMIAIVAPGVATAFPNRHRNLNGWLKSSGISAIFDVSFGAELTVRSYLRHINQSHPPTVIAQPCPAIVSYIELYRPELLPWLAPAGSPMHHIMQMVRNEYPQYSSFKIAVISPCVAKKREFEAIGLGDYNVTMQSLETHFTKHNVDLAKFPAVEFDGPPAERAVLFSSPGGLKDTLERWNPGAARATRKIEGPRTVFPYLDTLPRAVHDGIAPLLVDCLCCEKGCNGGTGSPGRKLSLDLLEHLVTERAKQARREFAAAGEGDEAAQAAVEELIRERDDPAGFSRTYVDRSAATKLARPSQMELQAVYAQMNKFKPDDFLNCGACGYGSCEAMAVAVFNGLNRAENCVFYLGTVNRDQERRADALKEVMTNFETTMARISQSAEKARELDRVSEAIVRLSQQTHIVALNARIEAARAGDAGAAFSVVSLAVRDLASGIRAEAQAIEPCSQTLRDAFAGVLAEVDLLGKRVVNIMEGRHDVDGMV